MAATKVISLRISWDLYREILLGCVDCGVTISEWIEMHLILVFELHNCLQEMVEDAASCNRPGCWVGNRYKELLEKFNRIDSGEGNDQ